jgi:DNA-binding response OmpR family regulator
MPIAPSAYPSSAGNIRLVEDDEEISRMLRQILSESGFTAQDCFAAGNVTLRHVNETKFDLRRL